MGKITAQHQSLPAGGGGFALPNLTIGVFLNDQPTHRLALGSDYSVPKPLQANEGWILPGGAEGVCEFDAPLAFRTVQIEAALLADVGLADAQDIAPHIGTIDPLILQMVNASTQFEDGDQLYRQTMQHAFAMHVARTLKPISPDALTISDDRLARVVDHIHDCLGEELSLETMAQLAAMSPSQFSRSFKRALGRSPLQYVIAQRIERAKLLLETTKLSIAEIAHRVGYADLPRFGQHFKRHVGSTPAAWRSR